MNLTTTRLLCVYIGALAWPAVIRAQEESVPVVPQPAPVSMSELAALATLGVSAVEVHDYAPGHYTGPLSPVRRTPT